MKNVLPLLIALAILIPSYRVGWDLIEKTSRSSFNEAVTAQPATLNISRGEVEVLNGCGVPRLADNFASFLRSNGFDVKNISDARSWNYTRTLVISRKPELDVAREVANLLGVKEVAFIRTEPTLYDVTVIIGKNFGENSYGQ